MSFFSRIAAEVSRAAEFAARAAVAMWAGLGPYLTSRTYAGLIVVQLASVLGITATAAQLDTLSLALWLTANAVSVFLIADGRRGARPWDEKVAEFRDRVSPRPDPASRLDEVMPSRPPAADPFRSF